MTAPADLPKSSLTTIHLLRHGEVHNPEGILYGRRPGFLLSPLGERMAERVADAIGDRKIDAVYASPLERAQQTAAPLAQRLGLEIRTEDRIIESTNAFEGSKFGKGKSALRDPRNWWLLRNPLKPSWGEPYKEITARMFAAIEDARDAHRGGQVVMVSHQLPIWTTRLAAEKRSFLHDPRSRQCTLCSLTSLSYDGNDLTVVGYSEPAGDLIPAGDRKAPFSAGGADPEDKPGGTER